MKAIVPGWRLQAEDAGGTMHRENTAPERRLGKRIMKSRYMWFTSTAVVVALLWTGCSPVAAAEVEEGIEARWYLSPSVGMINYEGDEEIKDGFLMGVRLG